MKIGILGGSFDPIHIGHITLAEYVREGAELDKIILLPAYESPFKIGMSGAGDRHRLNMTRLAAEGNEYFEVSSYDVDKGKVSYSVDLMSELQHMHPDDRLYFIAGTDSFLGIEKWRKADELLRKYGFVVGTRPGYKDEELAAHVKHITETYGTEVIVVRIPKLDVSSTDIRKRCSRGRSIKYLVPKKVEEYINANKLYRE
jgi:nicotinate-nucleotide adenylyltransferase